MSSKTPFAILFGGPRRSALDLPVAALAGLAVAFAMFTIPDDLLAEAVAATGIGEVIAAAQPPLGTTARAVLAGGGALAAFIAAFLLLRWLDRFAHRAPAAAPKVIEAAGPRIRRSDAHPDAPPCRPISASRDLGEPAPPARPASARPAPVEQAFTPEPATPAASAPAVAEPTSPEDAASPSAAIPFPWPDAPHAAPGQSQTLRELMARLEHGLARRERAAAFASDPVAETPAAAGPSPAPAPETPAPETQEKAAPPAQPSPAGDRLQSAMDGLRALSVRV